MENAKNDAARVQAAVDGDLKRTTELREERLAIVWEWKRNKGFGVASMSEMERLTAACEEAERSIYQCEIIERTYHAHKRNRDRLTTDDWREIVDAVRYAGDDVSGHEATPDWGWLVDTILPNAQSRCDAIMRTALDVRNTIANHIRANEINDAVVRKLSCVDLRPMMKKLDDAKAETIAAVHQEADEQQRAFTQLGDEVYETVRTLGGKHIPPEPKEVDQTSRRKLYDLVKIIKAKRGVRKKDLDTFLNKTTWTFKGFNALEIYKDVDGLNDFYNNERNWIDRHPDED